MTEPERCENLVDLVDDRCRRYANRLIFGEKRDGAWHWITYGELHEDIAELRAGLARLGVTAGDKVAIIAGNGTAWATAAYATYGLGAAFVPMYEAQRPEEWRFILGDCRARVVVVADARIAAAIESARSALPALEHVIRIDAPDDDPRSFAAVMADGRAHPMPAPPPPAPDTIAGLIYTSGTTGKPKGVILSHRNLASNVMAARAAFPIDPDDRTLSFLPWAHVYGQVVELHFLIASGASTAICTGVEHLVDELAEVKPTVLVAVPRIFNKMHDGILTQIAGKPRPIRALFRAGVAASVAANQGARLRWRARIARWLADRLIFAKIRARFGGRLRYAISASATLSREVGEFIDALGIPVYEGYGLTETSPVVSTNRPGARRMGSVGQVVPGVMVRLAPVASAGPGEGEIVVYGPNVMVGYHERPDETAGAIGPDRGLHTGDLGTIDDDGYLYITGRIKEQYKLENGKYVMPAPLEQALALSPYISNVMLYGANRPYNVALVAIDVAAVKAWAAREGVTIGADLATDPAVRRLIAGELERGSADWKGFERPRDFAIVAADFAIADDTLTPSLKIKRRGVLARYGAMLEALYPRMPTTTAPSPAPRAEAR